MDRNELLLQEDKNFIKKMISKIFNQGHKSFKKELIKAIDKTAKELRAQGKEKEIVDIMRKRTGVNISSISDLKKNIRLIESNDQMDESAFGEWWSEAKDSAFNALAFYPMLTMFLEFDKVLKGNPDASIKITLIYLVIWVMIIAGKITKKHIISKGKTKAWQNLSGDWSKYKEPQGGGGELYK